MEKSALREKLGWFTGSFMSYWSGLSLMDMCWTIFAASGIAATLIILNQ